METYTFSEFSFKILTFKIRLLETEIIIDLYDRDRGTEGPRDRGKIFLLQIRNLFVMNRPEMQ